MLITKRGRGKYNRFGCFSLKPDFSLLFLLKSIQTGSKYRLKNTYVVIRILNLTFCTKLTVLIPRGHSGEFITK